MGIELPAELAAVAAVAGVVWPQADEDKMRQAAGAWREAGVRMGSLTGDADSTARTTLSSFAGEANDAANRHWAKFVTPDTGHLTAQVTHCTANADKLEHAAQRIGEAKVAILRNLVELAKNTDAANSAASAGLPNALLGLQTAVRGTAANVANITDTLIGSVLPGGSSNFTNVVNANPGAGGGPLGSIGSGLLGPAQGFLGNGGGQAGQGLTGVVPGLAAALPGGGGLSALPVLDGQAGGGPGAPAGAGLTEGKVPLVDNLFGGGPAAQAGSGLTGGKVPLVDNLLGQAGNALTGNVGNPGAPGAPAGGSLLNTAGQVLNTVTTTATGVVNTAVETAAGVVHGASGAVNTAVGAPQGHGPLDPVAHVVDQTAGAVHHVTDSVAPQPGHQQPQGGAPHGSIPQGPLAPGGGAPGPLAPIVSGVVDLPAHVVPDLPVAHDAVQASSAAVLDAPAPASNAPAAGQVSGAVPPAQQVPGQPNLGGAVGGGGGGGPVSSGPASGAPAAAAPIAARPAAPVGGVVSGAPGAPGAGGSGGSGGSQPGRGESATRTEPGAKVAAAAGGASGSSPSPGRQAGADPAAAATDHGKQAAAKQDKAAAVPVAHDTGEVGGVMAVGMGIQGALAGQTPAENPAEARQTKVVDLLGGRAAGAAPTSAPSGPPAERHEGRVVGAQPPAAGAAGGFAGSPGPRSGRANQDPGLALFLVHMFPIGHLPIAAVAPARQLTAPPAEVDYAAGGRFAPGDHPRSALVDLSTRVENPVHAEAGEPGALADGHDPLGGEHERDWDRRFLVRPFDPNAAASATEYAWPPGEIFPEGGVEEGVADVLAVDTVVDRFGSAEGRVFAADGTPFAARSLPPALLTAGHHRYRVLRPLPVWRAVSAAWFAQPGGGVRLRATQSAADLVALGYLADITAEASA